MSPGRLRIGTSGSVYPHWKGAFYPATLRQKEWFSYYSERFDTAEINATFYRLPSQATVAAWTEACPPGFQFAWKASRYITQAKKLRDVQHAITRVYTPMAALGDRTGPTLFQLPPQLRRDVARLRRFLEYLPAGRQTIEFRHPSWFKEEVFEALAMADVALCIGDHHDAPSPWLATASFIYVRGHGPAGLYAGSYGDSELDRWASQIATWQDQGKDIYIYFDNDIDRAAPGDAVRLRDRFGGRS